MSLGKFMFATSPVIVKPLPEEWLMLEMTFTLRFWHWNNFRKCVNKYEMKIIESDDGLFQRKFTVIGTGHKLMSLQRDWNS